MLLPGAKKKVLYLHGLGSKPGGFKPNYLDFCGYEVINPKLPDEDFNESVKIAKSCFSETKPDVVVASSRGGAVALAAFPKGTQMILLCPAWKKFGVKLPKKLTNVTVLHSKCDEIVPYEDSIVLQENHGAELIECGASHRMIEKETLETINSVLLR